MRGSKLVEGDSCLLALTRYVHLNPVYIAAVESLPLKRSLSKKMIKGQDVVEDVSFINQIESLPVETVIEIVCEVFGVNEEIVYVRQRGSQIRPVAAKMLCKFAGLTQRDVADILNLKSGVSVSWQLPLSWKGRSEVYLYKLTDMGRTEEMRLAVTDDKVSVKVEKSKPYVIYPRKASVQKPLD